MIEVFNFEGKTEDICRTNCFDSLDVYDNEIITKEYEENNLFKMDVIKISDITLFIENYLNELFNKMNVEADYSVLEEDKIFTVKIDTRDNAIVIGKDGKNLSSLQFIIRQTLRNITNFNIRVNVDVSNYKLRKQKLFEQDIKDIINDVLTTKTDAKLDPMNSFNRRIVHNVASNYYNIETESVGEEPERYVTIKYIEK